MKYTTVLALAVAAAVQAADIDTVKKVISDSQAGIDNLDKAGKAFSGDVAPVVKASEDLIATLKSGKNTVSGVGTIKLSDAVSLASVVDDLNNHGKTLESDFKSAIPAIEKAGACGKVREQLQAISSASTDLINAVVGKVETAGQSAAKALADPLLKTLTQATDDFSESNCKGGSTGGSSTTTGATKPTGSASATGSAPGTAQPTGTCQKCQGGKNSTGTNPPPVTAGGSILAPAGALAVAIAAALL